MNNINGPLKVGIGGGIGTGKTSLTEALCRYLAKKVSMAVISNDIYTTEDAEYLMKAQVLPMERIKGVETGGCPHTAIREDCSINLLAVDEMKKKFPDLELILIESGGDNLAATFSPELVDLTIYMIDVAQGADIPRKKAPAIKKSDLLVINKVDLAPYVDVDLEKMKNDVSEARNGLPYIFGEMKNNKGQGKAQSKSNRPRFGVGRAPDSRRGGSMKMKREKVDLPSEDQYSAPTKFRDDILNAMKRKRPKNYERLISEYYKELVK